MVHRFLLAVGCLASLAAAFSDAQKPAESPQLYKKPLDVRYDDWTDTFRVVLTGTRTVAEVDVASSKITRETPWPPGKAMPTASEPLFEIFFARNALRPWARGFSGATSLSVYRSPRSQIPATQVAQGWVFTNVVQLTFGNSGIGSYTAPDRKSLPLDSPNRAYADPSDVVVNSVGDRAFVACAGADVVLVLDTLKLRDQATKLWQFVYEANDLTASRHYVIAKLPTQANPRRLALSADSKTLVVSNYLADSLTVIDAVNLKVLKHISLGGPKPDAARRGEVLFNSAKLTFQGQFSCASCHPNGGSDGLNWDLTRDGVGNPKNTKSLLGVKDTAPYGWLGTSATLADRVRGTLRTLHRYEPSDEEVRDLVAYLESLPAPAPVPLPEAEKEAWEKGKVLFEGKGACVACHSGPAFDDGKVHNVGTGEPSEPSFNTPSLRGVGQTASYLHDGRAATLEEIFTKHNPKQQHGDAHELSVEELADLVAYLERL